MAFTSTSATVVTSGTDACGLCRLSRDVAVIMIHPDPRRYDYCFCWDCVTRCPKEWGDRRPDLVKWKEHGWHEEWVGEHPQERLI